MLLVVNYIQEGGGEGRRERESGRWGKRERKRRGKMRIEKEEGEEETQQQLCLLSFHLYLICVEVIIHFK